MLETGHGARGRKRKPTRSSDPAYVDVAMERWQDITR